MANRGKDPTAKKQSKADATTINESPAIHTPEQVSVKDGRTHQKALWSGGSWKGKSAAVAEIAKESISIAATKASESVQSRLPPYTPPKHASGRLTTPSKSLATTKLSISETDQETPLEKPMVADAAEVKSAVGLDGNPVIDDKELGQADDKSAASQGWRGWLGGRGEKNEKQDSAEANILNSETAVADVQKTINRPKNPIIPSSESGKRDTAVMSEPHHDAQKPSISSAEIVVKEEQIQPSRATWFGLWGSTAPETENASIATANHKGPIVQPETSNIASDGYSVLDEAHEPAVESNPTQVNAAQQPQSSWAFWSRETPKTDKASLKEKESKPDVGELAVENTTSEAKPKPAQLSEVHKQESSTKPNSKKRDRPVSTQTLDEAGDGKKPKSSDQRIDSDDQKSIEQGSRSTNASGDDSSQAGVEAPTGDSAKSLRKKIQKLQRQNLLLPALHETFRKAEPPSYWQQVFRLFGRGASVEKRSYLFINPNPPKLRKALAIGVHGYFPGPLFAKVFGQPTGTSLRFANSAAAAIQKWAEKTGTTCEIGKIALEGEGMIETRVDSLWKLLLNWIDQIRNADFILFCTHSQGVPVATMLLSRLINFNCLNPQARLGMCALAGVSLGPFPFPSYQSRMLDRSGNELFEFSRPQSPVSLNYANALATCLKQHVRIVYIGSIDDQLVSLESALFATVSHPYIYRAVFVDGRIHAPGFITSLVGLACKLRNLGISDHGLIRELSGPLAGSLYSGEGHSRIYEDEAVYELAVEHALETSNLGADVVVDTKDYEIPSATNSNPYFLPWAMRGVLEEEFVRTELRAETDELLRRFEEWKPTSKVLKDVKFRLEAVRSKL